MEIVLGKDSECESRGTGRHLRWRRDDGLRTNRWSREVDFKIMWWGEEG